VSFPGLILLTKARSCCLKKVSANATSKKINTLKKDEFGKKEKLLNREEYKK
jgi:hypothetical protein